MKPFCTILPNKNKTSHNVKMSYSMDYELLKVLQHRYNFSSYLINEQGNWGLIDQNGHWNGSVGKIINQVITKYKLLLLKLI